METRYFEELGDGVDGEIGDSSVEEVLGELRVPGS